MTIEIVKTVSERVTFSNTVMSRLQRLRYMNDYECQHQANDADREQQIPCVLPWNPARAFAVRNGRIKLLDVIVYYTIFILYFIILYTVE